MAGTGWTVYGGLALYFELFQIFHFLIKSFFMQKLIIWILNISILNLVNSTLITSLIKFASFHLLQRLNERRNINTVTKNSKFNNPDKNKFYQWLVGFTDGDGSFSVIYQGGSWNLVFKIGQSSYNLRALYYIKNQLGFGSIYVEKEKKRKKQLILELEIEK